MTIKEAYQILGLPPGAGLPEVKKKYRSLMLQVHPDVSAHTGQQPSRAAVPPCAQASYIYSAQELNNAYAALKEKLSAGTAQNPRRTKSHPKKKQPAVWNAPVNENAYRQRDILQYVEDHEGTVIGNFCIARGKYMWTTDEDFSLFLLSLYQCGKQILDEADSLLGRADAPADRPLFQAELTYLLAQQFIFQTALLKEITRQEKTGPEEGSEEAPVFYIPSMLEASGQTVFLKPGEILSPSRLRHHRLYLTNQAGQEAGYLSFPDDRLYYVVIPLLEQRAVRIKIRAAEKQPEKKKRHRYQNLHVWIKLVDEKNKKPPENLNLQIEQLLEKYS